MRLLIAADIFPPESGGPATYAVTLANELVKQGVEVTIVSLNPKSDASKVSCPVFAVKSSFKPLRYWQYYKLLLEKGKNADVIYAMGPVNAGWPALKAAKKLGKKFVVKVVGDYAWEQGQVSGKIKDSIDEFQKKTYGGKIGWLKKTETNVVKKADKVIVPSNYLKDFVIAWGAKPDKVDVAYNAVKINNVNACEKPAGESWLVSVGRLVPWKGMEALIEIMAGLYQRYPNLKLKIIGSGPDINNLELAIKKLGVENSVQMLGELSHDQTLAYIKAANLFILNSGYEGLSHVILEALSLKIPVLASRIGGNSELIKPYKNGFLFKYNDKQEIERTIFKAFAEKLQGQEQTGAFFQSELNSMILKTKTVLENVCAS